MEAMENPSGRGHLHLDVSHILSGNRALVNLRNDDPLLSGHRCKRNDSIAELFRTSDEVAMGRGELTIFPWAVFSTFER